jgi:hypothetical protein
MGSKRGLARSTYMPGVQRDDVTRASSTVGNLLHGSLNKHWADYQPVRMRQAGLYLE